MGAEHHDLLRGLGALDDAEDVGALRRRGGGSRRHRGAAAAIASSSSTRRSWTVRDPFREVVAPVALLGEERQRVDERRAVELVGVRGRGASRSTASSRRSTAWSWPRRSTAWSWPWRSTGWSPLPLIRSSRRRCTPPGRSGGSRARRAGCGDGRAAPRGRYAPRRQTPLRPSQPVLRSERRRRSTGRSVGDGLHVEAAGRRSRRRPRRLRSAGRVRRACPTPGRRGSWPGAW